MKTPKTAINILSDKLNLMKETLKETEHKIDYLNKSIESLSISKLAQTEYIIELEKVIYDLKNPK